MRESQGNERLHMSLKSSGVGAYVRFTAKATELRRREITRCANKRHGLTSSDHLECRKRWTVGGHPRNGSLRYLFEDHVIDTDLRELHRGPEIVSVAPQVFDLLEYLIRNRDRVVSKDDWSEPFGKVASSQMPRLRPV